MMTQIQQLTLRAEAAEQAQRAGGKGSRSAATAGVGIDTKTLGRPESFAGDESRFKDWAIVMRSYSSLVNRHLRDMMKAAEANADAVLRSGLSTELSEASAELY